MRTLLEVPAVWRDDIPLLCEVDNGRVVCIRRFLYTWGLHVDVVLDTFSIDMSARYCYEQASDAVAAALGWNGEGDPPGPWIKEKMSERLGPGALKEDA